MNQEAMVVSEARDKGRTDVKQKNGNTELWNQRVDVPRSGELNNQNYIKEKPEE